MTSRQDIDYDPYEPVVDPDLLSGGSGSRRKSESGIYDDEEMTDEFAMGESGVHDPLAESISNNDQLAQTQAVVVVEEDEDEVEDLDIIPDDDSLLCIKRDYRIREMAAEMINHRYFRRGVLGAILLNSVFLAADQPAVENPAWLDMVLVVAEYIFTFLFFLEACIKVIALGFLFHPHAYLRSAWNVMDFVIVLASIVGLPFVGIGSNYSALRVFRVLRPLRSVSRVKKLKQLIAGVLRALPMVIDNVLLLAFIMAIFAIAAVQLWAGKLNQRCYIGNFSVSQNGTEIDPYSLPGFGGPGALNHSIKTPFLVANDPDVCGGNHQCEASTPLEPKQSCEVHRDQYFKFYMNYNNIGTAGLLMLKVVVLDNWPDDLNDAMNFGGSYVSIFFICLTLAGSFLCVNLFLAILTQNYSTHLTAESDLEGRTSVALAYQLLTSRDDLVDACVQCDLDAEPSIEKQFAKLMSSQKNMEKSQFGKSGKELTGLTPNQKPLVGVRTSSTADPTLITVSGEDSWSARETPKTTKLSTLDSQLDGNEQSGGANSNAWDRPPQLLPPASRARGSNADSDGWQEDQKRRNSIIHDRNTLFGNDSDEEDKKKDANEFLSPRTQYSGGRRMSGSSNLTAGSPAGSPGRKKRSRRSSVSGGSSYLDNEAHQFQKEFESESDDEEEGRDGWEPSSWMDELDERIFVPNDDRNQCRRALGDLAQHGVVNLFMIIITIINVVTLGVDHYGIDPTFSLILDYISIACTVFFALHIGAKVIAFGPMRTFSKKMNIFDLLLVLLAIPDIVLSGGGASGFSILRAFRMIRVIRLLRSFESLQAIVQTIIDSTVSVAYLSLLILLFLFVFAIMGMELFGTKYGESDPEVRDSFGTLLESILLCFIVVTGDDWTDKMRVAMDIGQEERITALIFFLILYMVGNYILINLFVAIIMDKLAAKMEEMDDDLVMPTLLLPQYVGGGGMGDDMAFSLLNREDNRRDEQQAGFIDHIEEQEEKREPRWKRAIKSLFYVKPILVTEDSLLFLSPENKFRKALLYMLGSSVFDFFIMSCVIVNLVFLVFESPKRNSPEVTSMLDTVNIIFGVIFIAEMVIKIIAFGAFSPRGDTDPTVKVKHQPAYFREYWNLVDVVVNILFIGSFFVPIMRASRSLRTLRLMIRNEKTKVIVVAVIQAIPHVLQGLFFVVFLFIVLGIMGTQLFKGEFYQCNDHSITMQSDCHGNFTSFTQGAVFLESSVEERRWEREANHFDHIGASILSLFIVAVGDGWSTLMYTGMDTVTPGTALTRDASPWMSLYFVVVFISCNFFAFNMIIGILINYFSKMKKNNDGSALLTQEQRLYVKARFAIDQTLFNDDLLPLENPLALRLHTILKYRYNQRDPTSIPIFDIVMTIIIVINAAFIASTHVDAEPWEGTMIDIVNNICLGLFTVEFIMKILAYGFLSYFSLNWNRFDFLIIALGYVSLGVGGGAGLSFVRVLRIVKLAKESRIQQLLATIVRSFNSFINVLLLLLLTFFIFAVAGVILFSKVKHNGALNTNNNFETVPNAVLVLYQISTTEGWSDMMNACSLEEPFCSEAEGNCGGIKTATAYFTTFMVVCAFTVLQLFVAVVVEIFTDEVNLKDPIIMGFFEMKVKWCERLGTGTGQVFFDDFVDQLEHFPRVLTELPYEADGADILRFLASLAIPVDSKYRVTYKDVVHALAWRKYRIELRSLSAVLNERWASMYTLSFTVAQAYATKIIQKRWRQHKQDVHKRQMQDMMMDVGLKTVALAKAKKASKLKTLQQPAIDDPLFSIMQSAKEGHHSIHASSVTSAEGGPSGGSPGNSLGGRGESLIYGTEPLFSGAIGVSAEDENAAQLGVPQEGVFVPGAMLYAFPAAEAQYGDNGQYDSSDFSSDGDAVTNGGVSFADDDVNPLAQYHVPRDKRAKSERRRDAASRGSTSGSYAELPAAVQRDASGAPPPALNTLQPAFPLGKGEDGLSDVESGTQGSNSHRSSGGGKSFPQAGAPPPLGTPDLVSSHFPGSSRGAPAQWTPTAASTTDTQETEATRTDYGNPLAQYQVSSPFEKSSSQVATSPSSKQRLYGSDQEESSPLGGHPGGTSFGVLVDTNSSSNGGGDGGNPSDPDDGGGGPNDLEAEDRAALMYAASLGLTASHGDYHTLNADDNDQ